MEPENLASKHGMKARAYIVDVTSSSSLKRASILRTQTLAEISHSDCMRGVGKNVRFLDTEEDDF